MVAEPDKGFAECITTRRPAKGVTSAVSEAKLVLTRDQSVGEKGSHRHAVGVGVSSQDGMLCQYIQRLFGIGQTITIGATKAEKDASNGIGPIYGVRNLTHAVSTEE